MTKINFQKVEQALEEGFRKFGIKQLLYLADLSNSFGEEMTKKNAFDDQETKALSLHTFYRNLQILKKKDSKLFEKLGIDQDKMKHLIEHPNEITEKEWEQMNEIRKKVELYRKELQSKIGKTSDEDLIKSQRKKQKDRRFNIKDEWLPLH